MWLTFFLGVCIALLIIYLPGFLQLFAARSRLSYAIVCAPIVSIFELCIIGIVVGILGISIDGIYLVILLGAATAVISGVAVILSKRNNSELNSFLSGTEISWRNLFLYVVLNIIIVSYFFIRTLDGPESFVQEFDNAFHLNLIHAFMESGRFSVLQATIFPTIPIHILGDITYYPAAWHVVAAVIGDILGISAEMSENITNVIFLSMIFPISMCAFVSVVFKGNKAVIPFCGLFVLAFAAFPWGFLVAGPLYPNLAAFSLLPGVMFCFIRLIVSIKAKACRRHLMRWLALVVVGIALLIMSQPNAIFTATVILTPYCMVQIYTYWVDREKKKGYLFAFGFFVAVFLFWILCRHLGMFQDVVNYPWKPYASLSQAIFDYLDLGYRNATAQLLLGGLVLFGILRILYKRQRRWLVVSYLFFFIAFLSAAATSSGFHGSFFSGFWYNDVDRIAASAVLVMILFAGEGLFGLICLASEMIKHAWGKGNSFIISLFLSILCVGLVFAPNHILAGKGDITTSIGSREARLSELATTAGCLTDEEEIFVSKVVSLIGKDAKVINFPYDGSVFAYTTNDLNTLVRHYSVSTSDDMSVIRKDLCDLSSDSRVEKAVKNIGAEYLLLLDSGDRGDNSIYTPYLNESDWRGITSVSDNTPGFELVLSQGDMRLYKIEQ